MYTSSIEKKSLTEVNLIPADPNIAEAMLPMMTNNICQRLAIEPIETVEEMACFIKGSYSLQKWRFFIENSVLGVIGGVAFGLVGGKQQPMTAILSYWIGEEYQGMGFATHALTLLMNVLENEGVKHYLAQVYPDNIASQKVLMKLGFECLDPNVDIEGFSGLIDFTLTLI
ncbi:GNAT family N-acetyltransferase [uncultured Shewanella sp.]|uniref:GNAT family N-acetyltransferase n=1 Tax=uncultured Shewanella sp. TaxID=173975 RepID=UPI00260220BA|nr:GNAT family N-acetyltransferase [uncultured Shewanella sp.]